MPKQIYPNGMFLHQICTFLIFANNYFSPNSAKTENNWPKCLDSFVIEPSKQWFEYQNEAGSFHITKTNLHIHKMSLSRQTYYKSSAPLLPPFYEHLETHPNEEGWSMQTPHTPTTNNNWLNHLEYSHTF